MNPAPHQSGIFIQRFWWWIRDHYRQLKPCRFSFLVALIACPVFLCVAQGTEVLRTVGEGMAGDQWYVPRVCGFFAALVLWAVCSWYAARVLLSFNFPGSQRIVRSNFAETHAPRVLGIAPILIVGAGFFVASKSYDAGTTPWRWLIGFAVFCVFLAVVFYLLLILRRKLLKDSRSQNVARVRDLSPGTFAGLGAIALVSLVLFLGSTIAPVEFAQFIGLGTILLLAASSWVALGSFFVFLGLRFQFPFIAVAVLLALLFSLWNDNHVIREVPAQPGERVSVLKAFDTWYQGVETNHGAGTAHPLYIVATEGGGIRAAYWTAILLGEIQDRNPNFGAHVFAISGVSGGSLGATVFNALLAEPNPGSFKFKDKAHLILGRDFLSPTLASMLYPDLLQRFLPWPIPSFDRGRSLELGWEKAWRDTMGNDRFAGSFVDLWPPASPKWMPALFLNGTSVEKGNRIITSNLLIRNNFLDAEDAADKLASYSLDATKATCHIPLSTAAHMSARFTFVSPAGHFPDGSRIVDGGYFENSGATTAYEIATRIKDWCAFKKIANVQVKVIMISNDPRKSSIMIAPAKPAPEPAGPKRSESETVTGHFMSEVTSPLFTMMNTRTARGTYAQKGIHREQRRFKAGGVEAPAEAEHTAPPSPDIFYFNLRDTNVPLPLGWMLSKAAADTMQAQLQFDDGGQIRNASSMDQVLGTLPPAEADPAPVP
jgi:hypothetical protein